MLLIHGKVHDSVQLFNYNINNSSEVTSPDISWRSSGSAAIDSDQNTRMMTQILNFYDQNFKSIPNTVRVE